VGTDSIDCTYAGYDLRASASIGSTTTPYRWNRESGLAELIDDGTMSYVQTGQGLLAEIDAANDVLGTVRARTDDTGTVISAAQYDAFGNLRPSSGSQGCLAGPANSRHWTTHWESGGS